MAAKKTAKPAKKTAKTAETTDNVWPSKTWPGKAPKRIKSNPHAMEHPVGCGWSVCVMDDEAVRDEEEQSVEWFLDRVRHHPFRFGQEALKSDLQKLHDHYSAGLAEVQEMMSRV